MRYSVKIHQFLGNANAPRISGHGSKVLLFTMQFRSKIEPPTSPASTPAPQASGIASPTEAKAKPIDLKSAKQYAGFESLSWA
jgi:hypothetical protein